MKDDLKRLINEFIRETTDKRYVEETIQLTNNSEPKKKSYWREPTFLDFIEWLNL